MPRTEKRQVPIVGSSFYPFAIDTIVRLRPGQKLRVEREPTNQYDPNAIAVYLGKQKLGHFPRGFAAEVAPFMDAGFALTAIKSRDPRFTGVGTTIVEWEKPDAPDAPTQGDEPPD